MGMVRRQTTFLEGGIIGCLWSSNAVFRLLRNIYLEEKAETPKCSLLRTESNVIERKFRAVHS